MTGLPLDLLPNFLCSLDTSALEQCSLVSWSFHRVARQLLFSHLVLCGKTWKAKCMVLLDAADDHLVKLTKSLTLDAVDMPVFFQEDEVPPLLIAVLQRFRGHRFETFRMTCLPAEMKWSFLNPHFVDLITGSILPCTSSLQLFGFTCIPLLKVIGRCPGLLDIALGAHSDTIGDQIDQSEAIHLPSGARSISFGVFGTSDFDANNSLAKYMGQTDMKIRSLSFAEYCSNNQFPTSLSFLEPFGSLTHHLLHLSFGSQLYDVIATENEYHAVLPLQMFPQLQTLQFAFSADQAPDEVMDRWTPWCNWVYSIFTSEFGRPGSLEILRFSMYPSDQQRPETTLDGLAGTVDFEIHICVDGSGGNAGHFEDTVVSVRNSLPSWDEAGNLKFWIQL
ncbi:hypothetical protein DL96DRAFT_1638672 [Flagelloscypha sp. PMI_526]|nr:hypothetical protein DL96DRAFT_1638672 [Flagelloscypha sp. PMI_526]